MSISLWQRISPRSENLLSNRLFPTLARHTLPLTQGEFQFSIQHQTSNAIFLTLIDSATNSQPNGVDAGRPSPTSASVQHQAKAREWAQSASVRVSGRTHSLYNLPDVSNLDQLELATQKTTIHLSFEPDHEGPLQQVLNGEGGGGEAGEACKLPGARYSSDSGESDTHISESPIDRYPCPPAQSTKEDALSERQG